jgi:hypothetical protein
MTEGMVTISLVRSDIEKKRLVKRLRAAQDRVAAYHHLIRSRSHVSVRRSLPGFTQSIYVVGSGSWRRISRGPPQCEVALSEVGSPRFLAL